MTSHLLALCFHANDPLRLARFWAGVRGWEMADDHHDGIALLPSDDTGFRIRFLSTQVAPPVGGDQRAEVDRLASLGATRIDIGQGEVRGW